jgi:hypothetical protein
MVGASGFAIDEKAGRAAAQFRFKRISPLTIPVERAHIFARARAQLEAGWFGVESAKEPGRQR